MPKEIRVNRLTAQKIEARNTLRYRSAVFKVANNSIFFILALSQNFEKQL
jgi:hypothetical protein